MNNTRENTPKHCWDCTHLESCSQAQHMTADTKAVKGYMVRDNCFCEDCSPDKWEDAPPVCLDWAETDSPYHCGHCGAPLVHNLTSAGIEYVRETIEENNGCCRELWPVVWAAYLEE